MRQILDSLANNGFAVADYAVFVVYILILVGCGVFIPKWMAKKKGANGAENSKDYFLAGNSLTWWAVGASLIAANISAEQFMHRVLQLQPTSLWLPQLCLLWLNSFCL